MDIPGCACVHWEKASMDILGCVCVPGEEASMDNGYPWLYMCTWGGGQHGYPCHGPVPDLLVILQQIHQYFGVRHKHFILSFLLNKCTQILQCDILTILKSDR